MEFLSSSSEVARSHLRINIPPTQIIHNSNTVPFVAQIQAGGPSAEAVTTEDDDVLFLGGEGGGGGDGRERAGEGGEGEGGGGEEEEKEEG